MGPTWGSPGADRTQVSPMLAPLTLLSGTFCQDNKSSTNICHPWSVSVPNSVSCVMIRVNCVSFTMVAAGAQSAQLGIGGLWAWYDLGQNVWVGFEHLQVWVLTCHEVGWSNFDNCLRIMLCSVETWVLFSTAVKRGQHFYPPGIFHDGQLNYLPVGSNCDFSGHFNTQVFAPCEPCKSLNIAHIGNAGWLIRQNQFHWLLRMYAMISLAGGMTKIYLWDLQSKPWLLRSCWEKRLGFSSAFIDLSINTRTFVATWLMYC